MDREVAREAYKEVFLERGFLEMQQYPEGFSVFKIEDPSEYTVDENWEPVQE